MAALKNDGEAVNGRRFEFARNGMRGLNGLIFPWSAEIPARFGLPCSGLALAWRFGQFEFC